MRILLFDDPTSALRTRGGSEIVGGACQRATTAALWFAPDAALATTALPRICGKIRGPASALRSRGGSEIMGSACQRATTAVLCGLLPTPL